MPIGSIRSGYVMSLASPSATSTRNPSTPRSSQKASVFKASIRTSSLTQFRSGWVWSNKCRYHCPHDPSGSLTRVHAGPPKIDSQLLGGSSPASPLPSTKWKRRRAYDATGERNASTNHG